MTGLRIIDTESMEWENGLDVIKSFNSQWRSNLGPADKVEDTFSKYNQKTLWKDENTGRGDLIYVAPGFSDLTPAYHDSVEECLFLDGECYLYGEGQFDKMHYFWRPPGWVHKALSKQGFLGILSLTGQDDSEGSGPTSRQPRPEEEFGKNFTEPDMDLSIGPRGWVMVNTELIAWQPGSAFARSEGPLDGFDVAHASFKTLSKNIVTGAQSLLVRLDAGYKQAGSGSHSENHRIFVISGSVSLGDINIAKGGFIDREAGSVHPPMFTHEGALLYVKIGGRLDFQLA